MLLDEPLPVLAPVVPACLKCNEGFSLDEQYLACFVECVICGATDPEKLRRPKIKRILRESRALAFRIAESQFRDPSGALHWQPEADRVRRIVTKLARGHMAYEVFPRLAEPEHVEIKPINLMSDTEISAFEAGSPQEAVGWPEIGSRAFMRLVKKHGQPGEQGNWCIVQAGRYRYAVSGDSVVRLVLSEYLACTVAWG